MPTDESMTRDKNAACICGDVPIPKDPEARRAFYDEAGLTIEERLAMEHWVRSQVNTKDPLHLLTNEQYDDLHRDLAEMARRRRRAALLDAAKVTRRVFRAR